MGNIELPKDTEDFYPLSDIQKGMVFYSLLDSDRLLYHNQNVYRVKFRDFDENLFRKAFELMVEKHPMLRTGFNMYDFKEPIQIVHKKIIPDIEHHDISSEDNAVQIEYVKKLVMKEQQSPFDVTNAEPFWRIRSVDTGSDNIYFIWICHHAIIDGWSFAALMTEVENTYFKLKENPGFIPGKLRNTYKRFVIEQLGEKKKSRNIDFWRKELENYKRVEFPGLSHGTNGNGHKINETKTYVGVLGNELVGKLNKVAKKHNTCLKHLCFGAYIYMLNMLSYENDIVAGLVTHNRPTCPDGDKIIGCFLNTIPVRVKIPSPLRWMDYILLIENKLLELKRYDRLSFFEIVRCIGEVTQKQNPVFDAMFNFTDFHIYGQMHLENDDTAQSPPGDENPDFDEGGGTNTLFDCNIAVGDGGLVVKFSFSETLINSGKAFALAGYLEKILYKFIEESEGIVRKDELICDEEKQRILIVFNRTEAEYPEDKTIPGLFKEQAKRTPDHIALIGPSIRGVVQLTYNRLDEESGRAAQNLTGRGIQPGTIAAIMVDRSVEMVVGILGILKAGGAYLPIEPGYPEERVHYMLTDSNAGVLLKKSGIRISINISVVLDFEQLNSVTVPGLPSVPFSEPGLKPSNLAYVIYTSGSTGKPKGVIVEHGAVVNILYALFKEYPFSGEDVYLFKTSFIFDVSVTDLFGWVLGGGRSALLESGGEKDPRIILDTVARYNVTHMNFVPSMFNYFADMLSPQNIRKLAGLKFIFLAGEALLPGIIEKFRRLNGHISIENIYGPTEATIYASKYSVKDWKGETAIPIGKPLANVKLFIIDKYDGLQAVGSIGELCIAGSGLARGYLNSPAITGEKFTDYFLESPRGGVPVRIYRTGDLTRWLPDGNIEFLGRIDRQVKIRGFRIELGDIESWLLKYGEIREAAAVAFDEGGECNICAYIAADSTVNISELKAYLAANLPYYMMPVFFKQVEKIPLTPGGKVDRNALPHPGVMEAGRYTAPRNELEERLVELWSEVLGIEKGRVGIDANFFELGGHSLKVTAMVARVFKTFNVRLSLLEIFKTPCIRGLAECISRAGHAETGGFDEKDDNLVLLKSSPGSSNHLFLIHDGTGEVEGYLEFCKRLPRQLNCWGLRTGRLETLAPQNLTIEALARKFIQKIKKVRPSGPYAVAGWSLGGTLAFEIAVRLEQLKEEISFFALIDSPPPHESLWKNAAEFDLESELNFIAGYDIPGEMITKLKNANGLEQFWLSMADYLETSGYDVEMIKSVIAGFGVQALPGFQQLDLRESLYYLNVGRTLRNARALYVPSETLHAPLHYFAADRSEIKEEEWNRYTKTPIKSYKITGDHFSIFKMPDVEPFAKRFDIVFQNRYNQIQI